MIAIRRCLLILGLSAVVAAGPAVAGDAPSAVGVLEVRVTDHRPAMEQFQWLKVKLGRLALHRKGAARRKGWVDLVPGSPAIDIVPLKDGVYRSLGERQVPIGRYDAVRVNFAAATGALKTGASPTLRPQDTVVAVSLNVSRQANAALVLDLFAEDQTEHRPPRYAVKVKEVRLGR